MKKHLLLLAALLVGLTECETAHMGNEGELPQEAEESVIVSLAMAGDITDTPVEPTE